MIQVISQAPARDRVNAPRRDLGGGLEDEEALEHTGVRHIDPGGRDDEVVVEEEVEVDLARPVPDAAHASEARLHVVEEPEKARGIQLRDRLGGAVQVKALWRTAGGLGLDQAGNKDDAATPRGCEEPERALDVAPPVAEV